MGWGDGGLVWWWALYFNLYKFKKCKIIILYITNPIAQKNKTVKDHLNKKNYEQFI